MDDRTFSYFAGKKHHQEDEELLGNSTVSGIIRSTEEAKVCVQELCTFLNVKLVEVNKRHVGRTPHAASTTVFLSSRSQGMQFQLARHPKQKPCTRKKVVDISCKLLELISE